MAGSSPGRIDSSFFRNLVVRQIRQDYLENVTGFAWLVIQPLLLLAVYAFVFTQIFKARIPDSNDVSFVAFLAVAFWPWTAFSEAILKSSSVISSHSELVTKVAFANEQLPLASVTATFLMHSIGYLAVLLVLQLLGTDIHWLTLPLVLVLMLMLWGLACAISFFVSATQVFIKDTAQILPPLMSLWFFTTPILYSIATLPPQMASIMQWNPMAWFVVQLRDFLLYGNVHIGLSAGLMLMTVPLLFWLGLRYFRRFSGHFEDFL